MGSSGSSVHGDSPGKYTGKLSHSVMSDSLQPRGLYPSRLLHPWDSPGKNTGVYMEKCEIIPKLKYKVKNS